MTGASLRTGNNVVMKHMSAYLLLQDLYGRIVATVWTCVCAVVTTFDYGVARLHALTNKGTF